MIHRYKRGKKPKRTWADCDNITLYLSWCSIHRSTTLHNLWLWFSMGWILGRVSGHLSHRENWEDRWSYYGSSWWMTIQTDSLPSHHHVNTKYSCSDSDATLFFNWCLMQSWSLTHKIIFGRRGLLNYSLSIYTQKQPWGVLGTKYYINKIGGEHHVAWHECDCRMCEQLDASISTSSTILFQLDVQSHITTLVNLNWTDICDMSQPVVNLWQDK